MQQPRPYEFNVLTFGSAPASGDALIITDGVMASGSPSLSSASTEFDPNNDQNKVMVVLGAGALDQNGNATALVGVIQSFSSTDPHTVTLNANAAQSVTAATCVYGTDDSGTASPPAPSTGFQAVFDAVAALAPLPCRIVIPAAAYIINNQVVESLVRDWNVEIVGAGIAATQLFVTAATGGFLSVSPNLSNPSEGRAMRTSLRDLEILTPRAGGNGGLTAIQVSHPHRAYGNSGFDDRNLVVENVMIRSMSRMATGDPVPPNPAPNEDARAYGFWDYGIQATGLWRPLLRKVTVVGQDDVITPGGNLDGNWNDDSWSFAMTCGLLLDDSYAPELDTCQVFSATRAVQMVSSEAPEGFFLDSCTFDSCREGLYLETPGAEPQATVRGGHMNCRDFNIGLFGKRLCMISDVLHYNLQTIPTDASTNLPVSTKLSALVSATSASLA